MPHPSFEKLDADYSSAEITCIFLHHQTENIYYNLLTVIELVPDEQEPSPLISSEKNYYLERINSGLDKMTVFIGRSIGLDVQKAVNDFKNITDGFDLIQGTKLNGRINFFNGVKLLPEPPEGNPLLMRKEDGKNHALILPLRNTDFRVWSKIDLEKSWQSDYAPVELKKIIKLAGVLAQKHMQFDLSRFSEHCGNAYLIAPNPLLRKTRFTLMDNQQKIMVSLFPRKGKRIIGGRILLIEDRMLGKGFALEKKITSARMLFEIPYVPKLLKHYIFSPDGILITQGSSAWMNINIQMNIQDSDLKVNIKSPKGVKVVHTKKHIPAQELKVGTLDFSGARYFSDFQEHRKHEELEKNKEFIFFTGHPMDKTKASSAIKELIATAKHRCIILDPYFGATDIEYAIGVDNVSVEVYVISSVAFLSGKIDKETPDIRHAHLLKNIADEYLAAYSRQKIHFKLLEGGEKSPLHDRYIVIDDDVYLLGSSLNEFGSRATCLVKVPAPIPLIEKATDWLKTGTIDLDTYIARLTTCP